LPFLDAVNAAISRATDVRERWTRLQNGVAVIADDSDLDAFLVCYGQMHYAKLADAMSRVDLPMLATHPLEIWDWGSGVGIGTFSMLDDLASRHIPTDKIFRIVFIDASQVALTRAQQYAQNMYGDVLNSASLHLAPRGLHVPPHAIAPTAPFAAKFHIISNVLDIPNLDVETLASNIATGFTGLNKFVLVSPSNNRASDGFDRFSAIIQEHARSYTATDESATLRKSIYRPFPPPASYQAYDISRRERLITTVLY
jgi:hypothetical protein